MRTPVLAGVIGALVFFLPLGLVITLLLVLLVAAITDSFFARNSPTGTRSLGALARGVPTQLNVSISAPSASTVLVRQPLPPDFVADTQTIATDSLATTLTPLRRGRHTLPAVSAQCDGPLRLGRWIHTVGRPVEVDVYPDLPAAHRLARAVKRGEFRPTGQRQRGPLGLGTEFESVRDYRPDDDVRQINWRASARLGRAMSNNLRVEQDRDLLVAVDRGRLMGSPIGTVTRLDVALDSLCALVLSADELGDRSGLVTYDDRVHEVVRAARRCSSTIISRTFATDASTVDSDHALALRNFVSHRSSLLFIFTDFFDLNSAAGLIEALPVVSRRHEVVVALTDDSELISALDSDRSEVRQVAEKVREAREEAIHAVRNAGAQVVHALPDRLAHVCIERYVVARSRPRMNTRAQ